LAQFADELFKQLSKIPLLSAKEEHDLWARCKEESDFEARQELIERYQPLVCKIITSLKPSEQVYLDLFQEGVVGLVEAVERFEPDRGFKFSTYATFRIRGRALTYLQKQSRKPQIMSESDQLALMLQNLVNELDDDPDEYVQNSFLLEKVYESIEELPEKERRAFEKVILKEEIPKEVAKEMRISRSYLSRLLKRAWKRLKVDLIALRREVSEA
jgi:RNA polymerase sporulation-specific sigma factor